jgi:hypothetical protein
MLKQTKPAAIGVRRAPNAVNSVLNVGASEDTRSHTSRQELARVLAGKPAKTTITAELSGVDTVVCCGVTTVAAAPIITLCQELVAEGFPPSTPLMVYRDGRLALPIRSIGEAAELEIGGKGIGFTRRKRAAVVVTASPVRQNGEPATGQPAWPINGARRS